MGKFKFKFENIVRIKDAHKKKIQRDISLIDNKVLKIRRNIDEIKTALANEKKLKYSSHVFAKDLQSIERYEVFIKKKINSFENEIEKLNNLRKKKLEELSKILSDEKMFDILREKHLQKFSFEENKAETKAFDEIAIQKAGRDKK